MSSKLLSALMNYARTHSFAPIREGETLRAWAERVWDPRMAPNDKVGWCWLIGALTEDADIELRASSISPMQESPQMAYKAYFGGRMPTVPVSREFVEALMPELRYDLNAKPSICPPGCPQCAENAAAGRAVTSSVPNYGAAAMSATDLARAAAKLRAMEENAKPQVRVLDPNRKVAIQVDAGPLLNPKPKGFIGSDQYGYDSDID